MANDLDPGPAPERGIVVRPEGEGFYARLYPRPRPDWRKVAGGVLAFVVAGVVLAFLMGEQPELRAYVFAGVLGFGLLLIAVVHLGGYVPVEVHVDDAVVYWHGDRIPTVAVADCRHVGDRVELVGKDHRVLATLEGLEPDAARWLALAVRASVHPP